jgi:uncharacterized membrane protein YkoI
MNLTKLVAIALVAVASTGAAQSAPAAKPTNKPKAAAKPSYKKTLPDSLARQAKIAEAAAATTALAKVPNGKISSVELEREDGKLLYSYDIKVAGKPGVDEVHVDAITGAVIGNVVHESVAVQKMEAKDKKAATKTTKKPPVK